MRQLDGLLDPSVAPLPVPNAELYEVLRKLRLDSCDLRCVVLRCCERMLREIGWRAHAVCDGTGSGSETGQDDGKFEDGRHLCAL